jgi:hypothetical protein
MIPNILPNEASICERTFECICHVLDDPILEHALERGVNGSIITMPGGYRCLCVWKRDHVLNLILFGVHDIGTFR